MEYIGLFFIGLVAVTIGTLAGGGGLITLPAMLLIGIPVHAAVGASKISNTVSSLSTFLTVLLKKKISFRELYWIMPVSLSGGLAGGFIANGLSEGTMLTVASVLLIVAFIFSFLSKGDFSGDAKLTPSKTAIPSLFGVGIYDGLFGPGQATILLQLFGHLNISDRICSCRHVLKRIRSGDRLHHIGPHHLAGCHRTYARLADRRTGRRPHRRKNQSAVH